MLRSSSTSGHYHHHTELGEERTKSFRVRGERVNGKQRRARDAMSTPFQCWRTGRIANCSIGSTFRHHMRESIARERPLCELCI